MARKKVIKCKVCNINKEVVFKGDGVQYPVFSCPKCGDEKNDWQKWWEEYKDRFKDPENWKKKKELLACVVGYFCYKYKEFYGFNYTFTYTNPVPYTSKDFTMGRRLITMFENDGPAIKNYIKWIFAKKVRPSYSITSLGFFTVANLVNEYKAARARAKILKRSSPLPKEFLNWCKENHNEVFDSHHLENWNDLNRLVKFVNQYGINCLEGNIVMEAVNRKMLPTGPKMRELEN